VTRVGCDVHPSANRLSAARISADVSVLARARRESALANREGQWARFTAGRIDQLPGRRIIVAYEEPILERSVMSKLGQRSRNPMRISILAAFVAVGLGVASVRAEPHTYHAPAHNYYQNSWIR
jgi:hypothetical protein